MGCDGWAIGFGRRSGPVALLLLVGSRSRLVGAGQADQGSQQQEAAQDGSTRHDSRQKTESRPVLMSRRVGLLWLQGTVDGSSVEICTQAVGAAFGRALLL